MEISCKMELKEKWEMWFTDDNKKAKAYEDRMHKLGLISTVEDMWGFLVHMKSPSLVGTDYHIFKEGIKPMWEDPGNKQGGKFILRVKKTDTAKAWLQLLLLTVGGSLQGAHDEICGVVVSVRHGDDTVAVWHRQVKNKGLVGEALKKALALKEDFHLEYKPHDISLNANSQRTAPPS